MIRTVLGGIDDRAFGTVLVHEHVMCDFIGAEKVSKDRYRAADVVAKMEPLLLHIEKLGVTGFVDCTPKFIGRDPAVLAELARRTGLHILSNTGIYAAADEKYVPQYAYDRSADELANDWLREWNDGIDGTAIKPGFIKIGVNPGKLRPIEQKIIRAACRVSRQTGCVIACHTGHTDTALETLGIGPETAGKHLKLLDAALMAGYEEQVLISQDAGWYAVGEPDGGEPRPYDFLPRQFVPMMRASGVLEETIHHLLVLNPAKAFRVDRG